MQRTSIDRHADVIVTEGMTATDGEKIYGVFVSEADARSADADDLAIAIVGADVLTPEQIELAQKNSEEISEN